MIITGPASRQVQAAAQAAAPLTFPQLHLYGAAGGINYARPYLPSTSGLLTLVAGTAYFVFVGTVRDTASFHIQAPIFRVGGGGGGTGIETAEMGVFITGQPPNGTAQNMDQYSPALVTAFPAQDTLSTTGQKTINTPYNELITTQDLNLWVGIMTNFTITQPQLTSCGFDLGAGSVLQVIGSPPLATYISQPTTLITEAPVMAPLALLRLSI